MCTCVSASALTHAPYHVPEQWVPLGCTSSRCLVPAWLLVCSTPWQDRTRHFSPPLLPSSTDLLQQSQCHLLRTLSAGLPPWQSADAWLTQWLMIIIITTHSCMYVLSGCTALHFPAPTSDTALTLLSYSVPGFSPFTMIEFCEGEPEVVRWLAQIVVPFILYWMWYWEMASSLCGVVQIARKACNLDNTALDRDRPVTWEGILSAFGSGQNTIWIRFYLYLCTEVSVVCIPS